MRWTVYVRYVYINGRFCIECYAVKAAGWISIWFILYVYAILRFGIKDFFVGVWLTDTVLLLLDFVLRLKLKKKTRNIRSRLCIRLQARKAPNLTDPLDGAVLIHWAVTVKGVHKVRYFIIWRRKESRLRKRFFFNFRSWTKSERRRMCQWKSLEPEYFISRSDKSSRLSLIVQLTKHFVEVLSGIFRHFGK